MKELFKKPEWLRPEINTSLYWVHILLLAIIVKFIMGKFGYCGTDIFVKETLYLALAIGFSDICAHSLLKLD